MASADRIILENNSVLASLLIAASGRTKRRRNVSIDNEDRENVGYPQRQKRLSAIATTVSRPLLESLRYSNEHKQQLKRTLMAKYEQLCAKCDFATRHNSHHRIPRNDVNRIVAKLEQEFLFDTTLEAFRQLSTDYKRQFCSIAYVTMKKQALAVLPISDLVSIMRFVQGGVYAVMLARNSIDMSNALRLQNGDVLELDSISSHYDPLRRILSFIILDILPPMQSLQLDDFEIFCLMALRLWTAAHESPFPESRMFKDQALNIQDKLLQGLGEHVYTKGVFGRYGALILLVNRLQVLDDLLWKDDFNLYRKHTLFHMSDEVIEKLLLAFGETTSAQF